MAKKSNKVKKQSAASSQRHEIVKVASTGKGAEAAAEAGRRARCILWDLRSPVPKWVPAPVRRGVLLPSATLALELQLARALMSLRRHLSNACASHGMKAKVRPLTFERWRFAAKFEEGEKHHAHKSHLVLPAAVKTSSSADAGLADELQRQGLSEADACTVAAGLRKESVKACASIAKACHQAVSGKVFTHPPLRLAFHRRSADLQCGEAFVKVGHAAYGKLSLLYRRFAPADEAFQPPSDSDFHDAEAEAAEAQASVGGGGVEVDAASGPRGVLHLRMFSLLLRYKSLCGHGFQAALGPSVWELLKSKLGVAFECFASPLNAHLPQFCSGFEDVDAPFGSRGSFFSIKPLTGSFAANPPFVHTIMDAMATHMIALLESSSSRHALAFSVFLPSWGESKAFQQLSDSAFLRRRVIIAAADHGYCDGASHQRQDPFRQSPYDTACFFLQTDRAAEKWPVDDHLEEELRQSMAKCVPLAPAVSRQMKKRKRPNTS